MKIITHFFIALAVAFSFTACTEQGAADNMEVEGAADGGGQSTVQDNVSAPDIVKVAVGSEDHTTLVQAVQAAELVDVLSNNGPFTVFAPTNDAFAALPEGTLEELTKPENKETLQNILYHHVQVSTYTVDRLKNSSTLMMFDGKAEEITVEGDDVFVGGAKILGTVQAANGIVHVVDKVILAE